ncbi:RagB/SusD family nutrient uptake outer membrane protein [Mucilaginibacter limnophilus]|uniref:RagB/SusD family nutrient uptake outer membrane protein n=1 Tax=Mucilaginibacter limnophilus TaxID=1932778 RepID=A0A437MZA3_9SPHI|nr:RagB/SusD family nutrient uptake outer membrane protein [Mucilaginibacter limnophilus]RVU02995.1 RagB/SusD family nutrient uptake outer membrane protein [Mucilaginibacter limnophilus]
MNYKKYIYGLTITGLLTGCAKLEEKPYGIINETTFYKTEKDANAAIIYAYAGLSEVGYYSRGYYITTELPTENLTQKSDAGVNNFELDELRTTSANTDLTNLWNYMYRGVTRANAVILNVPKISTMPEAARNQVTGEGYFLRALHYFNLVRLWGNVPLRTTIINDIDQIPIARSPMKDVYDLIISDLTQASNLMGLQKIEGRANKVAAQGLLAKVYLTLASGKTSGSPGYDFVTNADEMYDLAKQYSGEVVNNQSVYGFTNNLKDIWNITLYKSGGVTEHIFDAAADKAGTREGNYSKLQNMFLPALGFNMILDDGRNIGQGWNHFQTETAIYNSYAANDKRKTELIVSSVKDETGKVTNLNIGDFSRPFSRKYTPEMVTERVGDASSCNSPIIRFSDILLVYAEACGPTTEGYAAINKIRNRADIGNLQPGLGVQAFRDAVVRERSWELAFEGQRLFDLRRTNGMEAMAQQYGKTITSGAYFFPIPQREIDNNPLINQ